MSNDPSINMTIVFGTTTKLLSRLIRWVTRSRASHATIGLEIGGVPLILEATTGGVRIIPRAKWQLSHILVAEFKPKVDLSNGLHDALTHIGDAYHLPPSATPRAPTGVWV